MDGANCAVSFSPKGELLLQSRGHYLTGGPRERHFNLFKQWAQCHVHAFKKVLQERYIMYGEWLYAKHTIFYTDLPHYFMEFDILDKQRGCFLTTEDRRATLEEVPVVSVDVLHSGPLSDLSDLTDLAGPSHFIRPEHVEVLRGTSRSLSLDENRTLRETDPSADMEGLYIKVEENEEVVERYKFIRPSFLTAVVQSESHWLSRPIVPNQLKPGVDLYAESL